MGFYDYKAVKMNGTEISMSEYEGKVVVVVNTASKCGFTEPQEPSPSHSVDRSCHIYDRSCKKY